MQRLSAMLLLLVTATTLGADGAGSTAAEQGAALLLPFKQGLKTTLVAGLDEGPAAAVSACHVAAPRIAGDLSRGGVRVGRSSHRLRNPANRPPDWAAPLLAGYVAATDKRAPRAVTLPDDRVGYVEPIFVQPLCLSCHGEKLAPAVAERIATLYPEDAATGFETGDFRGIFWVEFPSPTD